MNNFVNGLRDSANRYTTENMAPAYNTTGTKVYDLFALGGAYRNRTDNDCLSLFNAALEEDETYAMKCLFYLYDVREGQGERRFFKTCIHWLANAHPEVARRNMKFIPLLGRWDMLYTFDGTKLEKDAYQMLKEQLAADLTTDKPSLMGKWLASENASSAESHYLGMKTRKYFGMTPRQYRKTLTHLRKKINVLERLMSANEWDKIEYDAIPSNAGFKYRKAFMRHDLERKEAGARTYADFISDDTTKVNAKVLYPYECVAQARNKCYSPAEDTERKAINKYWDNLRDYFNGASFNGMVLADTSGSMTWTNFSSVKPIDVALSLALYCADKNSGPFANMFITFESDPHFMEVSGFDFCDKVKKAGNAPWGGSTNISRAFNLILNTAIENHCKQEDMPGTLLVISDMEFDGCTEACMLHRSGYKSLMETITERFARAGYKCPKLVFWNINARNDNIPMKNKDGISFVSGFSPSLFEQIMSGKTAINLMYETLNKERYACIK